MGFYSKVHMFAFKGLQMQSKLSLLLLFIREALYGLHKHHWCSPQLKLAIICSIELIKCLLGFYTFYTRRPKHLRIKTSILKGYTEMYIALFRLK